MLQFKTWKRLTYILMLIAAVSAFSITNNKEFAQSKNEKILFKDSFPSAAGYVNDFDSLFSSTEKDSLENMIGRFEKNTTAQIAIITFKPSAVAHDSLEALTEKLASTWGVGKKETQNGIAIGICNECRRMTIRNGRGIEKILSNAETKEIIDKYFLPQFKEAKYFEGTVAGLQALIEILTKKFKEQKKS